MKLLTYTGLLIAPASALAHEGHGLIPEGVVHYLAEPMHLLPALAVIGVVAYCALRRRVR